MQQRRRNQFRYLALLIVAFLILSCAPATAPGGGGSAAPAADSAAPAGEPQSGGSLTIGTTGDILNFDAFSLAFVSYPMQLQCYDRLLLYDAVLNKVPQLATEWEVNAEGTALTLKLREGVKFHNGREFVADDVVQNFARAIVPDTGSNVHGMVKSVDRAEAIDDHTVVIHFTAPTPNMFDILNAMGIMAPESFEETGEGCVGTGPFKFQEWVPGDHLTFVRNEEYWDTGKPYLDEIIFKPFSDLEALVTAMETGIVDAAVAVPPKDYQRLLDAGVQVPFGQTGALLYTITLNPPDASQEPGPLSDKRVRQALCWSVDRAAMLDQALFGVGGATVVPFPDYSLAYFEEYTDAYSFDLEKAAALLEEAGWTDGNGDGVREKEGQDLVLRAIMSGAFPETTDMAQILKADLATIGVNMETETLESAVHTVRRFGQENNGSGDYDLDFTFVGRQHLDPLGLFDNSPFRPFSSPVHPEGDFPEGYVENLTIAQSTIDEDVRREAFKKVQEIMLDSCTSVTVSWKYTLFAHQDTVHDLGWSVGDEVRLVNTWVSQ